MIIIGSKSNKLGEINYNKFGSKMKIIEYRKYNDIDVYFPEYDWTFYHARYDHFKEGNIKCPYSPSIFNKGCIGEGKYKPYFNCKATKEYSSWKHLLERCYDRKLHEKFPNYKECKVEEYLLNFQNFGEWHEENYYEVEGERMHLDKDILVKGNKIYNRENMVFVPERINTLFTKRNKCRGDLPIGVSYDKKSNSYIASCKIYDFKSNKQISKHIGVYNSSKEGFYAYKIFKENHIKEVADYYKGKIPQKLYDALINYKVEITD